MNEIADTQGVQLGAYQDAAPLSGTATNNESLQDPYKYNNMESFMLDKVIQREYQMATINWATSSASGTLLQTYNFPNALFAIPFISQKINDFRYFRAGVRMTFRMTTTRFLYGKLMIVFKPTPNLIAYGDGGNIFRASSYPHVLLSASAGESVVFDFPFVSQKRGLDLKSYVANEMAAIQVYVINPLTDVMGEPATGQVFVTAQFLDAEVWLPHDQATPPTALAEVEVQSGRVHIRRGGEAKNKSILGTISSGLEDTKALVSSIGSIATHPVTKNLFSMATSAGVALAMAGLSKPTTQDQVSVVRINPYSDIMNGKGIDTCPKLGMDPENQISTEPNVGGINEDEMKLSYIVGTPTMVAIASFLPASTPLQIATTSPFDTNITLVDFVSRNFAFRSGSLKFKIYITASQFHAVRMVFYLSDAGDAVNTDWQSCYHRVVDFQGDTEVEIMTPYCSNQICQGQTDSTEYGLWAAVLSWSQPDNTISAPIHLNVYKAGDSDMRFAELLQMEYNVTSAKGNFLRRNVEVQSNPRADFRKTFQAIHDSVSGYTHKGFVWGEEFTTLREVVHKYHAYESLAAGQPAVLYYANGSPSVPKKYVGVEMWGLMYNYWRGSIRVKMLQKTYTSTGVGYYQTPEGYVSGMVLSSPTNPLLDAECPYYRKLLFVPTTSTSVSDGFAFAVDSTVPRFHLKAAGDDFSFHFLHVPPPGTLSTISANFGVRGLVTFMST